MSVPTSNNSQSSNNHQVTANSVHSAMLPKKWKLLFVNWLFVYPVINLMFALIFPLVSDLPQLLKTLIFTVILVPLMGFFIPKLHQKYWKWIIK